MLNFSFSDMGYRGLYVLWENRECHECIVGENAMMFGTQAL